jgi:hypothetical protein
MGTVQSNPSGAASEHRPEAPDYFVAFIAS